ncbi:hypothetical protein BT96DRAFT_1023808 [Gymnopus androsaceus JB14]|uniref:Uncharacterized protein n=1 Tax=Gymnopus androsaceus JB14 TaxID=1447944 RepID=A0A6A4H2P7_9AGAR|nr:hypothetical protein BT96DRAFT_1023808 [Gymnopus androsaceus JB14]
MIRKHGILLPNYCSTAKYSRDSTAFHRQNHYNQHLAPSQGLDVDTPTPTRPTTPRNNYAYENSSDESVFNQPRSSAQASHQHRAYCRDFLDADEGDEGGIVLSDMPIPESRASSFHSVATPSSATVVASLSSHSSSSSNSSLASSFSSSDTPPLSPDGGSSLGTFPSILSLSEELELAKAEQEMYVQLSEDHGGLDAQIRPEEIREGKKPERVICYDALIDDLAGTDLDVNPNYQTNNRPPIDDADEWYGLEYTLELSCKERRPSETYSYDESAGESSRSHESWAALRRGTIHPFFEDEDYYQWTKWHRYLDREDERRKHRKGLEFRARSRDMAWVYLNEMRAREVMYWQLEVYGGIEREVRETLSMLAERRRDPYYPAKKHNLGWYLKRSRSVGCLRELQPKPTPKLISRGGRSGAPA